MSYNINKRFEEKKLSRKRKKTTVRVSRTTLSTKKNACTMFFFKLSKNLVLQLKQKCFTFEITFKMFVASIKVSKISSIVQIRQLFF